MGMRTVSFLVLFGCVFSAHGTWDIGGKVGMEQQGSVPGFKSALKAEYRYSRMVTWRTDLELLFPHLDDWSRVTFSLPTNLLVYPLRSQLVLDPYIGPGLTYRCTWDTKHFLGANILGGINFKPDRKQTFGIELKYTLLFLPELHGCWEYGLTGAWAIEF